MRVYIEGYRNLPGEHCGSTAMRNLLFHYCGLEYSEAEIFGLGSGLDFLLIRNEKNDPAAYTFGRSLTMEVDVAEALGIDYREAPEPDEHAWDVVRHEVDAGRPTMLSGDAFYLDYRDFRVHFPSHRYVLLGYDDAKGCALVADRIVPDTQECGYGALALSRNPPLSISTHNLWGKFHDTKPGRSFEDAVRHALAKSARRMLGVDTMQEDLLRTLGGATAATISTGLSALRAWHAWLPEWQTRSDARALATYSSNTIEKYGTGGGNFRVLYTQFLQSARTVAPGIVSEAMVEAMARSAEAWHVIAQALSAVAAGSEQGAWGAAHAALGDVIAAESAVFEEMAAR